MPRPCLLLVEDEALVALELLDVFDRAGFAIAAWAASVQEAHRALRRCRPDAAVLDVSIQGELIFPVADELDTLQVPFVFLTGHNHELFPTRHLARPCLSKPCAERTALRAVARLIDGPGAAVTAS